MVVMGERAVKKVLSMSRLKRRLRRRASRIAIRRRVIDRLKQAALKEGVES